MKIYVSEKDLSPIQINQIKEYGEAAHYFRADIERYVKIAVSSLEQHEAEIRKPLEDEIVSLRRYISQLEYWKSYWYNSYDEIRNKYNKNQQVKQERQKVIAELEEWANNYYYIITCYLIEGRYEGVYCIDKYDLKQKLNEMKEV